MDDIIPHLQNIKNNKRLSFILSLIGVGIISYLSIRFAYRVGFASNDIVAIWPAAAISYWAIRKFGPWAMLPIFLADAIHLVQFLPHLVPVGFINGIGNALAPWLGVIVERRFNKISNPFENVRFTLASLLAGMGVLSLVASLVGTTVISLHYHLSLPVASGLLWQWYLSDYTGCLVFAPVLLTITQFRITPKNRRATLVDSLVILLSILGIWYVTNSGLSENFGNYPTVFFTMPAMIWLSLREDTPRVLLGVALLAVNSFIITIQVLDIMGSTSWIALQLYIMVIVFSAYIVHTMQLERIHLVRTLAHERDVLEQRVKERTKELEELATRDGLTGIMNRRCFFETAAKELKRARGEKPISLILLDIDEFKKINDTFGHAVGDHVLLTMTQTILEMVRNGADSFSRMGGEEFTILLPETTLAGALQTAERLRAAIETLRFSAFPVFHQYEQTAPVSFNITCSFGVVEWDIHQMDINHALSLADEALYQAKNNGRNRVESFPKA